MKQRPLHERIDQSKIRKRSDYEYTTRSSEVVIPGDRVLTKTGFTAQSYLGSNFEIRYEAIAAGAATPTFMHPKKDKVIRILSGVGQIIIGDNMLPLVVGDDLKIPAGTKYRITSESDVYLMVIQASKYDAHVETDDSTMVTVDMENRIQDIPQPKESLSFNREPSKAVEQQLALAASRSQRLGEGAPTGPTAPAINSISAPMPSYGKDLSGEPG